MEMVARIIRTRNFAGDSELIVELGYVLLSPSDFRGLAPRDVIVLDHPKHRVFGPSFSALVYVLRIAFFAHVQTASTGASAVLMHREDAPKHQAGIARVAVELTRIQMPELKGRALKPREVVDLGAVDYDRLWLSANGKLFGRCSLVEVDGRVGATVLERI
jgi:hypothetical protein